MEQSCLYAGGMDVSLSTLNLSADIFPAADTMLAARLRKLASAPRSAASPIEGTPAANFKARFARLLIFS
ncbi:MAG TPA: hypothetical protein VHC42_03705, partial [Rhizomicrobium sp.]|nr:hypothetical protein [Rhizomicrobium sp.]